MPRSRISEKKVILKNRFHDCAVRNSFLEEQFSLILVTNHMCTNAPQLNRGLSLFIKLPYISDTSRPVAQAG